MRKIIYSMNMTLDGYYAGPNGELDWVIADDELHDFSTELLSEVEAICFGRVTYELLAAFWPTAPLLENLPKSELDFAHAINRIPKFVCSKMLRRVDWENTTLLNEDIVNVISRMKQEPDGTLGIGGGAGILAALMQRDLIDEYRFMYTPVVLGNGKPLFTTGIEPKRLRLVSTRVFNSGVIGHNYEQT